MTSIDISMDNFQAAFANFLLGLGPKKKTKHENKNGTGNFLGGGGPPLELPNPFSDNQWPKYLKKFSKLLCTIFVSSAREDVPA